MSAASALLGRMQEVNRRFSGAWVLLLLAVTAAAYCASHASTGLKPTALGINGWWEWNDQGKYVIAARAWAAGSLDPAQHWYLPGYPLLGAMFVWLTPVQPFYVPDLLCLLAYAALFVLLAEQLAPAVCFRRSMTFVVFLATTPLSGLLLKSFVQPWSSTPTAAIALASLFFAIRFSEQPTTRGAFLVGLTPTATALFRPTEALILVAVVSPFALAAVLRTQSDWRSRLALTVSGVAGALASALLLLVLYLVIYGPTLSNYIQQSRATGFEWRLLALRWVTLFVSPRPLFKDADAYGLVEVFPWILLGFAGMVACLTTLRGPLLRRHVLVVTAIVVHCAVFLTYRDLHPQGLIRYQNYHYFKWTIPLFGLYAAFTVTLIARASSRRRAVAVTILTVITLFFWRVDWVDSSSMQIDARIEAPSTLIMDRAFDSVSEAVLISARGGFHAIYDGNYSLRVGERGFSNNNDVKSFPVEGGFIFMALRPLPDGPARAAFPEGMLIDPTMPVRRGHEKIAFGFPSWRISVNRKLSRWLTR